MSRHEPPLHPRDARAAYVQRRRDRRRRRGFASFMGKHLLLFSAVIVLILMVDFVLYALLAIYGMQGGTNLIGPTSLAESLCATFERTEDGSLVQPAEAEARLDGEGIGAFLLAADGSVLWSHNVPADVQLPETPQDVALMAHYGYLDDRPIFVYTPAGPDDVDPSRLPETVQEAVSNVGTDTLLVLVYPIDSYYTFSTTSFDESTFATILTGTLLILTVDLLILLVAYLISRRSLARGLNPLSEGIERLAHGKPASVDATGDLAEIADDVNAASELIRAKDQARANWVSGVSHDIRTPLSTVMGYADRIAQDPTVPERSRTEASIIRAQSVRMRDLVEDLNLASKLEYDLQPLRPAMLSPNALARTVVAEFLDSVDPSLFRLEIELAPEAEPARVQADARLVERALRNVLQNATVHNPQGCAVHISSFVAEDEAWGLSAKRTPAPTHRTFGRTKAAEPPTMRLAWCVRIADDGCGVDASKLWELQNGPASLGDAASLRSDGIAAHGLGLLLVRGIAAVHGGTVHFVSNGPGTGLAVTFALPVEGSAH